MGVINVLQVNMNEKITLSADSEIGQISITLNVPSPALADVYRKMFAVTNNVGDGDSPSGLDMAGPGGHFYKSIQDQQIASLGLTANISSASIVPRNQQGMQIAMQGSGFFIETVSPGASLDQWRIVVGLRGADKTNFQIQQVFENLYLGKWMLQHFPGLNEYELTWDTRLQLPSGGILSNGGSIAGLNWRVDFGGDSYLSSTVSLDGKSTLVVKEIMKVTENSFSTATQDVLASLEAYKKFDILYQTPHSTTTISLNHTINLPGIDPTIDITPSLSVSPSINGLNINNCQSFTGGKACVNAGLNAGAAFNATAELLIKFEWPSIIPLRGLTLDRFMAAFTLDYSISARVHAEFNGTFTKQFTGDLFSDITLTSINFVIGCCVPVNMDLVLTGGYNVTLHAEGKLIFDFASQVTKHFKAGVDCNFEAGTGCQPINENPKATVIQTGPTVSGALKATVNASLPLGLKLLFYGVIGPFVAFVPEANAGVVIAGSTSSGVTMAYDFSIGFEVDAGLAFADGIVKDIACAAGILPQDPNKPGSCQDELSYTIVPFIALYRTSGKFALTASFSVTAIASSAQTATPLTSSAAVSGTLLILSGNALNNDGSPVSGGVTVVLSQGSTDAGDCPGSACPGTNSIITDPTTGKYSVIITAPPVASITDFSVTVKVVDSRNANRFGLISFPLSVRPLDDQMNITPVIFPQPNAAGWTNGTAILVIPPAVSLPTIRYANLLPGTSYVLPYQETVAFTGLNNQTSSGFTNSTTLPKGNFTNFVAQSLPTCPSQLVNGKLVSVPMQHTSCLAGEVVNVTLTWSLQAGPSGVASTFQSHPYCFTDRFGHHICIPPPFLGTCGSTVFTGDTGGTLVICRATNGDGVTRATSFMVKIDRTPPLLAITRTPPDANGWNNGDVTVTFQCTDDNSGVAYVSPSVVVTTEGAGQSVTGACRDNAGNTSRVTVAINIDKTPPQTSLTIGNPLFISGSTYVSQNTPLTLVATDTLSGVFKTQYGIDDSSTPTMYTGEFTITGLGPHTVYYQSIDKAGNIELVKSMALIIRPSPEIHRFMASPLNLDLGQEVTFDATASGGNGGLSYSYSGLPPGCTTANGAALTCIPSATGKYRTILTVTDSYSFIATSNPLTITISPDPAIISFSVSPTSTDLGQSILLIVSAGYGTGQLSYSYSGLPSGCSSSNSARLSCTPSASGTYTLGVVVSDEAGGTASSSATVTVGPARVIGLPAAQGYAIIGGMIAVAVVLVSLLAILFLRRRTRPA
jgi:hypothetical protein